jgi:hypothetical protein
MGVTGSGTAADPFVLSSSTSLTVADSAQFDLTLSTSGVLSLAYASTAKLANIPDVNAGSPANGQVLGWNSATSKWVAQNPTTAAAGSVLHDQSLAGDGSGANPLAAVLYAARFLQLNGANGIGLSDAGINQLVRHFVDDPTRAAAIPAPALNTLSMLDTVPGRVTYWDGVQWSPLPGAADQLFGPEFLALSGPYLGSRTTHLMKPFTGVTDASGNMDILTPTDLSGRAGVLMAMFQETGASAFKAVLWPNTDRVSASVYRLSDGTPYASFAFTGLIDAWLY